MHFGRARFGEAPPVPRPPAPPLYPEYSAGLCLSPEDKGGFLTSCSSQKSASCVRSAGPTPAASTASHSRARSLVARRHFDKQHRVSVLPADSQFNVETIRGTFISYILRDYGSSVPNDSIHCECILSFSLSDNPHNV